MRFGERKGYSKGDRVWVRRCKVNGVATVTHVNPLCRNVEGKIIRSPLYTVQFDNGMLWKYSVQDLKLATELESQRSKDAAVDAHIKALREAT